MGIMLAILKVLGIIIVAFCIIAVVATIGCYLVWLWARKCYATPEEQAAYYPGDELMERFDQNLVRTVTAAVTIDAPPEKVWPWIYQWGGMKSGSISSELAERVFGRLSIFNRYELQDLWQAPDSLMPGDFADWDRSGMGHEIADVVEGKYILGFSDMQHPPRARGSFALTGNLVDDMNFIWGWYFIPLEGGKTRFICHWKYYESKSPVMRFVLHKAIYCCGSAMQRWQMEYVEKLVAGTFPVSRHNKIYRKVFGGYCTASPEVQAKTHCPIERDGRSNPAVEEVRPAKLADPAWPPADGPWDVDKLYYRERIPEAIREIEAKAAEQQRVANLKIEALKQELAALDG